MATVEPDASKPAPRPSFFIRTYGCQMNVHDSEKVANLLHHAGWEEASEEERADLLLINTCSIRDKAEQRLYSDLGALRSWKAARPRRAIGVGGCVAQQEGDTLLSRFDQLDFAFGTHNLQRVPQLADAAAAGGREVATETRSDFARFDFPERHPAFRDASPGRAFVTVMEGCDMFCSFCIVPHTRGREISRPWPSIVEEVTQLAAAGVREVTLLGQTVNAYGRHDLRRGRSDEAATVPFAQLVARISEVQGIERIRYTSPHPVFFDDELVAAHASLPALCPHVHLPLQSGSDRVLRAMRRRYDAKRFLEIAAALRDSREDLVLTSDVIVGFPGETEADFRETLSAVEEAGFVDSYSFKYSPRPGTPAVSAESPVAPPEAQRRLEELQALQRSLTLRYHRSRVGDVCDVLLVGESRRGGGQWQGRDPYNRVVNVQAPVEGFEAGAACSVGIVEATPHSLVGELTGQSGFMTAAELADDRVRLDART